VLVKRNILKAQQKENSKFYVVVHGSTFPIHFVAHSADGASQIYASTIQAFVAPKTQNNLLNKKS